MQLTTQVRDTQPVLRCVVVQIDFVGLCHDLAVVVVSAGATHMVRALEFTAVRAFRTGDSGKGIVGAAHVALGTRDPVLLDSHDPPLLVLLPPGWANARVPEGSHPCGPSLCDSGRV